MLCIGKPFSSSLGFLHRSRDQQNRVFQPCWSPLNHKLAIGDTTHTGNLSLVLQLYHLRRGNHKIRGNSPRYILTSGITGAQWQGPTNHTGPFSTSSPQWVPIQTALTVLHRRLSIYSAEAVTERVRFTRSVSWGQWCCGGVDVGLQQY